MGQTDSTRKYVVSGVEQTAWIGSYTQLWSVGNNTASPALTFVVGQFGSSGTVSTTNVGQTSDGHLQGVSSLSITDGVVSTYSATALDPLASLYYDPASAATLFDEGKVVTHVDISGTPTTLTGNATAWHDYDLQTDHFAVTYFVHGGYQNPLYWGSSCDGETGDCTLDGSGNYPYWVTQAAIYVGSTLADQTNIPQDGSTPTFSDQSAWSFLGSGQTLPVGPSLTVRKWEAAVIATIQALGLAKSVQAQSGQDYPLPILLELVGEATVPYVQGRSLAGRTRTYLVKDTAGHAWDSTHGRLTIFEKFIKVFGSGGLPDANNPAFHG